MLNKLLSINLKEENCSFSLKKSKEINNKNTKKEEIKIPLKIIEN